MSSQDYRVSTVAILCRDCQNDVGLYPGKHKCPPRPAMPAMPAIPSQYQSQTQQPSYSSRGMNGNGAGGRRPPDLDPNSLHSGGSGSGNGGGSYGSSSSTSRTPTSSSFQDRMAGSNSRTPTALSFQERMKERDREKQLKEREEREAAARSVHNDSRDPGSSNGATPPTSAQASSTTAGSTLWNRLKAAKEVINATITGEEKWPESDDSDYEGETHVSRILREHADNQEEAEMAKKIAELEMTPYESSSKSSSLSRATGASAAGGSDSGSSNGYGNRSQYMRDRDTARKEPSSGNGGASGEDYYSRSLRARGAGGDGTTSPSISSMNSGVSNNSYGSSSSGGREPASANRYRTTSDLSRDDALSRLEGKSQGDKLATQVSHLGSTTPRGGRANSPNPATRTQDNSSNGYQQQQQQGYGGQLSPNQYPSSSSLTPSQRSVSPASNRRYDSPSPSGPPSGQGRYAAAPPPQPASPSYPNNNNSYGSPSSRGNDSYGSRGQPPPSRPGPGQAQGGRPDYDRRPTYPPQGQGQGGPPPQQQQGGGGGNLGAYGQRQQYQQYQQQQQRQQQYSSNNYF
ncbi:hypothetical protein BGX24_008467 [Mortierella sp. AD032]|nr:hypothetical protein BGX24_008467 [Mortierella sp. AD032]